MAKSSSQGIHLFSFPSWLWVDTNNFIFFFVGTEFSGEGIAAEKQRFQYVSFICLSNT